MTDSLRDDERFQAVLGRLDALVRRSQPEDGPPPPPPAVSEATIPVLTDVYLPADQENSAPLSVPPSRNVEDAITEMLPEMVKILVDELEQQAKPALSQVFDTVIAEMRPQIEEHIRQRLSQALAKRAD